MFVCLPKGDAALQTAGKTLSCAYIGVVALKIEGKVKTFDPITARLIGISHRIVVRDLANIKTQAWRALDLSGGRCPGCLRAG